MPIYEYQCEQCGHVVEQKRSVADRDLFPVHPHGEKDVPMPRIISRTSFSLKGGGWYADGYSKNTGKPS